MFLRTAVVLAALLFVAACNYDDAVVPVNRGDSNAGAIYLPGGTGLVFSSLPSANSMEVNAQGIKYVLVKYGGFSSSPKDIDQAVSAILEADGYVRAVERDNSNQLHVNYRKAGENPVYFRYSEAVSDGLQRKTMFNIWWVL